MVIQGGEEKGSARSRVDRRSHDAAAIDVEIDPKGRRFSRCQTTVELCSVDIRSANRRARAKVFGDMLHALAQLKPLVKKFLSIFIRPPGARLALWRPVWTSRTTTH